ncbi:MAG: M48 family metalloprotease [Phycisphaeraceae bacterium]|nr:M48 family metalloprotease [Phycisphaeraceae bacterium]
MKLLKWSARLSLVVLFVLLPLVGCSTNEATGRSQFLPLSWQEEVQIGAEAAPQFIEQSGGELPDQGIVQYVRDMGARLAAQSEMPDIAWEFYVLDSQVINAFALPGGKVFISRGLMAKMDNEAQLAGVIGHEIGHVTARHGNERMGKAMITQGLILAAGIGGAVSDNEYMQVLGVGTAVGGQLFLLKYSRGNELEADALGVRYMAKVGYNPIGQIQVMEILREASGGGAPPEWLSTHPASDTRISNLEAIITQDYPRYNEDGFYNMGFDSFKQNILTPLNKLPPAKHGASAMLSPAEFEKIVGIPWEHAVGQKCTCHP